MSELLDLYTKHTVNGKDYFLSTMEIDTEHGKNIYRTVIFPINIEENKFDIPIYIMEYMTKSDAIDNHACLCVLMDSLGVS